MHIAYKHGRIRSNVRRIKMDRKMLARKIVEESAVLLKNEENILPFPAGKTVAFFGRAQIGTLCSGNGSGGANVTGCATVMEECEKSGINPETLVKGFYEYKFREEKTTKEDEFDWTKIEQAGNSGIMYEIFGRYRAPLKEYEVPEYLIRQASEKTDTALIVLGRNSGGEECDRHLTEDYYLTQTEKRLVDAVCTAFSRVVVVLNINGLIDLSWTEKYSAVKGIVFLGIPGEEGAQALARILSGRVNPSGKLTVTVAQHYEDYPSAEHFSWNKDCPDQILTYEDYGLSPEENGSRGFDKSPVTVYQEDIYAGYRYFDTFSKNVRFPFGYGLSYTDFRISPDKTEKTPDGIKVTAVVENTGSVSGKEVVQVYLSKEPSDAGAERPYQELKGFEKTTLLSPGEKEEVSIFIPWKELAVYREEQAEWVIEKGAYLLYTGNSSRNTQAAVRFTVNQDICVEIYENRLKIRSCNRGKIDFLRQNKDFRGWNEVFADKIENELSEETFTVGYDDVNANGALAGAKQSRDEDSLKLADRPDWTDLDDFTDEELAALCVGYGPGTPFSAVGDCTDPSTIYNENGEPLTTNSHPAGYQGYVSPAIKSKGISSVFYKDGPAGIGETVWPTEMLIACAFDRELWRAFGDAVGTECEERKVDVWLAPAVNLHRNPLCGRNFEYFSEDPYLTGICACEIVRGVQEEHPVLACPKHFAVNEQETFRRGNAGRNYDAVDSILTERAARELYLKPFEMLVRNADISCIMTSFNKINGVFSGGNKDLCSYILRDEWGFQGAVVTDWGDMDMVVDGADAVAAGNDIVMPGGPPVIHQILKGLQEGRVTRENMENAVRHLLVMISKTVVGDRKEM